MAFKNEYVPPLEQETSEYLSRAREMLRKGHLKNDAWTVDRENDRVLARTGRGHEIDDQNQEYWEYLDGDDRYSFVTSETSRSLIAKGPPMEIALSRDIQMFWGHAPYKGLPDSTVIQRIKEAFQVYGAHCMASQGEKCVHTLLWNGKTV